jgi:hypothetical protein
MAYYEVYGYYSRADAHAGRGEYLETFETLGEATEYAKDFERFFGLHAWVVTQNNPISK